MPATVYSAKDNEPIDICSLPGVIVVVTVPAAFSGTCTSACVPSIIEYCKQIKEAGAERIIVVSTDQPFALNEWKRIAKWDHEEIEFASDYDKFEMRTLVGKLSDEEGKEELSPSLGGLIRRSYSVIKDGTIVWQFIEPDTTKYTLKPQEMIDEVKRAKEG
jgi:peroxiredoxin